jgi:hypothetical protein
MDEFEITGHELIRRTATEHGNGAHVYVPKEWRGSQLAIVRTSTDTNEGIAALVKNPFDIEDVPHVLTVGGLGSGKSYSVNRRALRWGKSKDNRTVIFLGVIGEPAELVEAINGTNIVVDNNQTINPLGSTVVPANISAGVEMDRKTKVTMGAEFIGSVLKSQDIDPDRYFTLIESLLETTFELSDGDDTDTANTESGDSNHEPTMDDFLETAEYVLENHEDNANDRATLRMPDHQKEQIDYLLTALSVFEDGGDLHHLNGQTTIPIEPGSITHLDLQQMRVDAGAEQSPMLQLIMNYLDQAVMQLPGETMVVVDEAHLLLDVPPIFDRIEQFMRGWRQHNGCLWLLTQSPQDVVRNTDGTKELPDIASLAGSIEFFQTSVTDDDAARFDLSQDQAQFLISAVAGDADEGYSEGLVRRSTVAGWSRFKEYSSPIEDAVLTSEID